MNYMQSHISNHKAGTPFYMAPEVVQHGVLSKRADIFSYGVVLWEIYHQSCPIQTSGGNGNLQYHEKFPKFPVSCPMLYALLCVVCLSPSPEDRPDFDFVLRVLRAIRTTIDNVGLLLVYLLLSSVVSMFEFEFIKQTGFILLLLLRLLHDSGYCFCNIWEIHIFAE